MTILQVVADDMGWTDLGSFGSEIATSNLDLLAGQEEVSCAIPGMRNRDQLLNNIDAARCKITNEDRERLEGFWKDHTDNGTNLLPW